MSAGGARRGRRDNGLDAADFAVAGDVDPRVGEHLLDVLGAGGIAAYLQPSSDLNPVTRTTTMPPRPVDRLYVDSAHLETAKGYLAKLAAEEQPPRVNGHDADVDAAFSQIVARFDAEVDTTTAPPWPAAESLPPDDPTAGRAATAAPPPDPTRPPQDTPTVTRRPSAASFSGVSVNEPSLLDGLDTFGADLPDDPSDDEGYTPPPPPPLPRISKFAVAGVLGIVVGFVLFLFPGIVPVDRGIVTVAGFLAILAGFVTLVSRLRHGNDDDVDPDDGARV